MDSTTEKIAVVGLGYVGLPVALAFARMYPGCIGFDIDGDRIAKLKQGLDWTGETDPRDVTDSSIEFTSDPDRLRGATFFVVTVPTPITHDRRPDLSFLVSACETIGAVLEPGAVVVFESTVYPGLTEEICGPILARKSGLMCGLDFKLGYSPERINPGDTEHTLERIIKVVSGQDPETAERIAAAYRAVVPAGIHMAPSIKVAEAAKVLENTQRDLNIALMNELAIICSKLSIRTRDVLDAAATKWNFLNFQPGLVGGHCIGVDPYYLTAKAESLGYSPDVILAGRRINDEMGAFIAREFAKRFIGVGHCVQTARVGILGLTFKENVADFRNSGVPSILNELVDFGFRPIVHDPLADRIEVRKRYGIEIVDFDAIGDLNGLILAVPHAAYLCDIEASIFSRLGDGGVLVDVKSAIDPGTVPSRFHYWSL